MTKYEVKSAVCVMKLSLSHTHTHTHTHIHAHTGRSKHLSSYDIKTM
jgi:hypothetical protein